MATGSVSSLGLGSDVLTYDVIESLREADEENIIVPIDEDMEENVEKQAELTSLMTTLETLQSSASYLSDLSSYLERSSNTVDDGEITASAGAGLAVQDIEIVVDQLAKTDIFEVGTKYEERDSTFSDKNSTLSFYANGTEYEIEITGGSSLEDVAQQITDATDGEIYGTILKTGGDKPYQLMINTKETGKDNKVYFGSTTESYNIKSGDLAEGATGADGELTFTFGKLSDPSDTITVNIDLTSIDGADEENGTIENTELLNAAIKEQIAAALTDAGEDASLYLYDEDSEDTWNNPLHIELGSEGKSIIVNDSRGEAISVGGTLAGDLGFKSETIDHSYTVEGGDVLSGLIDGTISIAGQELDLSAVTASGNTASENAEAIAAAISGLTDLTATVDSKGNGLLIKSDTGANITISYTGSDGTDEYTNSVSALSKIGLNTGTHTSQANFLEDVMKLDNIQAAVDAEFTYNDLQITRGSNYVDDIVSGLTITLNKAHKEGESSIINVTQDTESLIENAKAFVETYNELITALAEYTKYDADTGESGIFQGQSDVYSIRSSLNTLLLFSDADNNTLIDYGIYLDEDGSLELDEEKLTSKIEGDPEAAEDFFRGYTTTVRGQETDFDGVFTQFNDAIANLIDGSESRLKLYETSLEEELDRLQEEREEAVARLDSQYEIMAERFAAYDSMIAEINSSFQSLQMMIEDSSS